MPIQPSANPAPIPFVFGAEWRGVSRASTAMTLVDLSRSPKLAKIAQIAPEVDLRAVASSMISRPEAIERVIDAAERAGREEDKKLRKAAPELWASHPPERAEKAFADLRKRERETWARDWRSGQDWPLAASIEGCHSMADTLPTPMDLAPDGPQRAEATMSMMAALARGAEQELRKIAIECFGAEAMLFSRATSPQENHASDGINTPGVAMAEIDRRALQEAAARPQPVEGKVAEVFLWSLCAHATGARGNYTAFVAIDLGQSPAAQASPLLTPAEAALAILGSGAVARRAFEQIEAIVKETGAADGGLTEQSRQGMMSAAQESWRKISFEREDADQPGLRVLANHVDFGRLREVKDPRRSEEEKRAVEACASRAAQAMAKIAAEAMGPGCVVFARAASHPGELFSELGAYAQKQAIAQAIAAANAPQAQADSLASEAKKARKPRAL